MHVVLLVVSTILLLLSIYRFHGDIFSPTVMMMSGYFLCSIFAVMGSMSGMETVSTYTVVCFISGWISFIAGEMLINYRGINSGRDVSHSNSLYHFKISLWVWIIVVIINVIITMLLYREIIRIAGHVISNTDFNGITYAYKQNIDEMPLNSMVKQLLKITKGCAFVFAFIFANNVAVDIITKRKIYKELYLLVPPFLFAAQCFIRGGRFTIIALIIAIVVSIFFLYQSFTNWRYRIKLKTVIKIVVMMIVIIIGFWWVKGAVGRTSKLDMSDYLVSYLGGSYNLFDSFVKAPLDKAHETFAGIVSSLNKLGLTDIPARSSHEFRKFFGGVFIGNAHSANRNFYNDFGFAGIIVMNFLYSIVFNSIYKRLRRRPIYSQKYLFIFYISNVYCLSFHFFADYFFAQLSFGYLLELAVMFAILYILTDVKVSFGKYLGIKKEFLG